MAFAEDPRSTYIPELGHDITFIYYAIFRGRIRGLFTPKILCKQHGDVDKVVFPCRYIFTSDRDIIYNSYSDADTNMATATASIRALLQWFIIDAQPFSATRILVSMKSSSMNE